MAHIGINMQPFASGFETYIVGPLAEGTSQAVAKIDNLSKDQRTQICDILKYDIKALTFNIATLIGVAYVVEALFGSIGLLHGVVGAGASFFIREVANESLAATKSKNLKELFSHLLDCLDRKPLDDKWEPDYISWNKICILTNLILTPKRVFKK